MYKHYSLIIIVIGKGNESWRLLLKKQWHVQNILHKLKKLVRAETERLVEEESVVIRGKVVRKDTVDH